MDYNPANTAGCININGHMLFGMTGRDVVTTVANGRVLMKDREIKVIDVEEAMAKCERNLQSCGTASTVNQIGDRGRHLFRQMPRLKNRDLKGR